MEVTSLWCRACLCGPAEEPALSLHQLHEETELTFAELLTRCTGISLETPGPGEPARLCTSCASGLCTAWTFIIMCRASDERLRTAEYKCEEFKLELKLENETNVDDFDTQVDSDEELLADVKNGRRKKVKAKKVVKNEPITCEACGRSLPNECRYKKHIKSEHPDLLDVLITYPCETCGRHFKRRTDLRVHVRIHSGEKPFICDRCPRRFAQSGSLIEHKRHHTGETPFACEVCGKLFSSRSSCWRHRRVHTKEKPFSCEKCGKSFAHSSTLRTHALVHSKERPHTCRICGRAAKSIYSLRSHMSLHREKEYVCERCGKKFALKSNLDSHMKAMHGTNSGKCTICSRDTSDLKRHMMRHSDEPIFHCDICSRAFKLKSALVFHLGFHNDAAKYKCMVTGCEKAFPKLNMLEFHTRKLHSNETPHVCKYCQKGFFRISDLSRHLNTAHPVLIGV